MNLSSLSQWLEQVTQPQHPCYHPIQATVVASISYISTACFTNIPPIRGVALVTLTYAISQLVTPFFIQIFESYQDVSLVPLLGQVLQFSVSVVLAKFVCQLANQTLSFKEIRHVSAAFLICLFVARFALRKFRQQLQTIPE